MGGLKPDHKTIARFRRDHAGSLKNVLKQCARVCLKLGLIEGNTLFVDGTKVRANASMKNTWTGERCRTELREIDRRIDEILEQCEAADRQEQHQGSLVKLQKELKDKKRLKSRVAEVLKYLNEQDKKALNATDPESC